MFRVLIIDDEKLIRWSLKEMFSQEGYSVDTAGTTEGAIELVKKIPYDLICADLEMKSEDIGEMFVTINECQPETKIIILSALSRNQAESYLEKQNVFSIIEKPFKSDQMKSIARQALDLKDLEKGGVGQTERKIKEKDNQA